MTRFTRLSRLIGAMAAVALVATALFVGPAAQAKAKKKCAKVKYAEPQSDSENRTEAPDAKVVKITEKYTEKKPLVIEDPHGPAFWFIQDPVDAEGQRAAVEDTSWYGIQVDSKGPVAGLYIRQEWTPTPVSDQDLYLYDKNGLQAGASGDFNQVSGTPLNSGTGGPGFEQISGLFVSDCAGFMIESRAFTSPGEPTQVLKVWLGEIQ